MVLLGAASPVAAQSIGLAWDPNTEDNLAGYRVYIGTASGSYSQSADVPPDTTTYTFVNPTPGTRYYFAVTAYNTDGLESAFSNEVSALYGTDTTAPSISITSPAGATTVTTSNVTVSGTAADAGGLAQVTWKSDRGASGTASGTASWSANVPLQPGANLVTVTARDLAGNTKQASVTITYDASVPAPVLISPSGTSSTKTPAFTWNAVSVATAYQLWVNDSTAKGRISATYSPAEAGCESGTGICRVSPGVSLSGTVQWWVKTHSAAGESAWSTPLTFTIGSGDSTAPSISITSPAGATTVNTASITVSGSASDNVGVTQVTWASDRGPSGTAIGTSAWSTGAIALQAGANVITVTARDAAGNTKQASVTVTYNAPDTTAPSITIISPAGATTVAVASVLVSGTASDNVGVTQVAWATDRGASGTASGTTAWSATVGLQAGANVITVTARDAAGNTKQARVTVTYSVPDTTPPTISIAAPANGATLTTASATVSGVASDNVGVAQVTWTTDRGNAGTASGTTAWVASVGLQVGVNVVTVTARDAAGNTRQASVSITYDPSIPAPVLISPSGTSSTKTPTFTWNAVGVATAYHIWVNDSIGKGRITTVYSPAQAGCESGSGTCRVSPNVSLSGTVQWWVKTYSALGESPWSTPLSFTIGSAADTTAPSITIASPAGATTVATSTITVSGTAADNVGVTQVTWSTDRGASGTASGTSAWSAAGIPLQSGTNVITVTARDAAGNTAQESVTVTYNAPDTTAPSLTITSPAANATVGVSSVAVSGTASDNVGVTQVTWANDRGGSGTASGTTAWSIAAVALQAGANVITVTARDAAGNTRTASVTVTFSVPDTTAPAVVISTPANGATVASQSVTVSGTASDNVGVTQVTWSSDRGGSGTAGGTTMWTANVGLQPGANVITITARDAAGNTRQASVTVSYEASIPAPVLISPSGTSSSKTPTFTWNAVGIATGYQLWVNDSSGKGRISAIYTPGQVDCSAGAGTCRIAPGVSLTGTVQWWVKTISALGESPWSTPLSFTIGSADTTDPLVTITKPAGAVTVATPSVDVAGTASDNIGVTAVTWSNDRGGSGTATGTTAWSVSGIALQTGANVITITAADAAGNSRQASVTVTYAVADSTAPSITIASPAGATTVGTASVSVSGTAADNVGVTQVTWATDRGASGTASGTTAWSAMVALQPGANVITVTARDAAGNTRQASVTVTYDASVPAPVLVSPSGSSPTGTPTFTWNAVGIATGYQIWVNDSLGKGRISAIYTPSQVGCGSGAATCRVSPGVSLSGTVQWWVKTHSALGESAWSVPLTFTIGGTGDTTAPVIDIIAPANGTNVTGASIIVSGTASDNVGVAQVTWSNDRGGSGTAAGTTAWSTTVTLQAGTNVITVTARDAAGNTARASVTVTLNWQVAVPPPPALLSPDGAASTSMPTFTWYAVPGATMYQLFVNDSTGTGRIQATYTADEAGCGSGTGTCTVYPGVRLSGSGAWWARSGNAAGQSAWSLPLTFTVP